MEAALGIYKQVTVARDGRGRASLYLFDDNSALVSGRLANGLKVARQHPTWKEAVEDFLEGMEALGFDTETLGLRTE